MAQLLIKAAKVIGDSRVGDSIMVNGVCLTAVNFGESNFTADVMAETLDKSNLGKLKIGDRVNLERALSLGDRLGGHIVSGHIDGIGTIVQREKHDIALLISIKAPEAVMRYIIKKGSVAIDGISLTVVDFAADVFRVSLIPTRPRKPRWDLKLEIALIWRVILSAYIERMISFSGGRKSDAGLV